MPRRRFQARTMAPALSLMLMFADPAAVSANAVDVVVQAGHAGRPASCAVLHVEHCNLGTRLGAWEERAWTPIVADAAARRLRAAGLSVRRRPADYRGIDRARAAIFLHFDGSVPACRSGASVGFPNPGSAGFARRWLARYRLLFPFRIAGENITPNEAHYYGYRHVEAPGRTMLVELGEMTCPMQARWLAVRLRAIGDELGRFAIAELNR